MTAIVVDTSAILSILLLETDSGQIAASLENSDRRYVSAATLLEAFCVVRRPGLQSHREKLQPFVDHLDLTVMPFENSHLEIAKAAYARFGRGSKHAAGLNMGDCYSYALAKALDLPLLFKGNDFIHTDIVSAVSTN